MGDETNVLQQEAEKSGFIQDVFDLLNAHGVNERDSWLFARVISAWAYDVAGDIAPQLTEGAPRLLLNSGSLVLSGLVNVIEQGATPKAAALTMASYIADVVLVGPSAAAIAASLSLGAVGIAGAGVIAGTVGGLAVDYLTGLAWDTVIGPNAKMTINQDQKEFSFTVNGLLSDFLQPRGDLTQFFNNFLDLFGNDNTASNVWEKFDLVHASVWSLEAMDSSIEPLKIRYQEDSGFTFSGINGCLQDISYSSLEHQKIIELICQEYSQDFDATTSVGSSHVFNYYGWSRDEIGASVLDGNKATIWAVESLRYFVEEESYPKDAINLEDYSTQYLIDRASFPAAPALTGTMF